MRGVVVPVRRRLPGRVLCGRGYELLRVQGVSFYLRESSQGDAELGAGRTRESGDQPAEAVDEGRVCRGAFLEIGLEQVIGGGSGHGGLHARGGLVEVGIVNAALSLVVGESRTRDNGRDDGIGQGEQDGPLRFSIEVARRRRGK